MLIAVYIAGSKGNLCQRKVPLSISLALTFPAAVMAAYYLLLQTYALRLEAILNAILLLFYGVELLLGILTLAAFSRYFPCISFHYFRGGGIVFMCIGFFFQGHCNSHLSFIVILKNMGNSCTSHFQALTEAVISFKDLC